jgi:nucleotide-binding universal stress UspA family protein
MLPVRTILHPTDFSEQSRYALRTTCALARDSGARVVILHVAQPPTFAYAEGVIPPEPEEHLEEARAQLLQFDVPDPRVRAERRLEEGDPVTAILRVAREVGADLIVMGTHGRRGLGRLLLGSVAELVVRRAACPVLTVKTPVPEALPSLGEAALEPAHA